MLMVLMMPNTSLLKGSASGPEAAVLGAAVLGAAVLGAAVLGAAARALATTCRNKHCW
jgi:ABC-type methionine transport system permease subunit